MGPGFLAIAWRSAAILIAEPLTKGASVWAHAFEYACAQPHAFEHACAQLGIEHRATKPKHPWTNGQSKE